MPSFSAKDIQALRVATGVGMLDAKRALEACDGDADQAGKWLREQGLASAAKRAEREATQGAIAVARVGDAIAVVQLRSETDFVAKSAEFVTFVNEVATKVATDGEEAVASFQGEIERMLITLKENISVGQVARVVVGPDQHADAYLHIQDGRGKNAVVVVLNGGSDDLAHDIAVHAAFTKPAYVARDDVPAAEVADERATIEAISRKEGKPEASLDKVIEGRLTGWFKDRVLLEQVYVKDEKAKQTIAQLLGSATIAAFIQVLIEA
jgi:elongation factor Ts